MPNLFWSMTLTLGILLFTACSEEKNPFEQETGELIFRKEQDRLFTPPPPLAKTVPPYPWEEESTALPKITKEHFRCRGSSSHPPRQEIKGEEKLTFLDCGGKSRHSLPLFDGKEGVYPILIDLLNYLQTKTGKKVVVTSGHRCPDHQLYVDSSKGGQTSKKMVGAEVNFYVQGYESRPLEILKLLFAFYDQDKILSAKQTKFERYLKEDIDVKERPWMNWEIFIKLYGKGEGRDLDNRHPYPFFSIQVRRNRKTGERVIYDWNKAYHNFLRY